MANLEKPTSDKVFLSIVQGSLRQSVPEGTPDAVRRDWEAGGEKGVKHELVYKATSGKIINVSFFDGESGGRKFQNLNITLGADEGEKKPVISVGVNTRYGQDILKKLPNVDFNEEVRFRPFAFQPEGEDKTITGVEITQQDSTGQFNKKMSSFFHAKNADGKWESKNDYPVPEGDTDMYTSDDWQIFYKRCNRFLVEYTKENIVPKFAAGAAPMATHNSDASGSTAATMPAGETGTGKIEYPEEDISPDDIPF